MDTTFHVAAYRGSVGAGLSNVDIAAVQDGQLTISNSHFVLPKNAQLMWAFGLGTNLSRLRLNTPKMRYVGLPSLVPINSGTTVPSPMNLANLTEEMVLLDTIDEIAVEASSADAGAQTMTAIVAFSFGVKSAPAMPTFRVRGTTAITQVAGSWVNGTVTLDQTIPRGTYAIVGYDCVSANGLAARMVFSGYGFRPGVICRNSATSLKHMLFDSQAMGVFGTFDSINFPTIDILANGAGSSQEHFFDLVRMQGSMSSGF